MTAAALAGVVADNTKLHARSVVLTVGTFLGGRMLIGDTEKAGGRAGDAPSNRLAARLRDMPFNVARLKTGTPPRLDGKTIDWASLDMQAADEEPVFPSR